MSETPIWHLSASEASRLVESKNISPMDLVESCLARIEAVDGKIFSYVHVAAEQARAEAVAAERAILAGHRIGPLHGLPFAVKDNYDVAGMPATAGSRVRLQNVPIHDAPLVAQLRRAGAILLGKLATWEYGTGNGGEYFDLPFPPARNAWDIQRFTGGSSTGAGTGVAAGTTLFALGSDTTGSVRLPAAATGTLGMIPTPGRFDRRGILPNCFSLDIPGIIAWTAEDAAMIFAALTEQTSATPAAPLRVGVVADPGPGLCAPDPPLRAAFDAALDVLAGLGVALIPTALPVPAAECFAVTRLIGPPESAAIHERELREEPENLGFALRDKLLQGSLVSAVDYIAALRRRTSIAAEIDDWLSGFDAVVTFGPLHTPPRLGVEPEMTQYTVETMLTPFNLSGHPALCQCIGFTGGGLPLCWQIAANRDAEFMLLHLAQAYEAATPWRGRRPEL